MKITISKQVIKYLNKQEKKNQSILKNAIMDLPEGTDIKYFKSSNSYRMRVGDFRILYHFVDKDNIHIDKIGPRGDVYK